MAKLTTTNIEILKTLESYRRLDMTFSESINDTAYKLDLKPYQVENVIWSVLSSSIGDQ